MLRPDEIKRRRLKLGLSLRAASEAAGWGENGFARWDRLERGVADNPTLSTLEAVARALRCRVRDLVD